MNLSQVWKLLQFVLTFAGSPLVTKLVDNLVAGTTTRVDDWVWRVVRAFLAGGSINDVEPGLAEVQKKYDEDQVEAKKPGKPEDWDVELGALVEDAPAAVAAARRSSTSVRGGGTVVA